MNLLINSDVYGWRMTGLLGEDSAWFLGFSKKPVPKTTTALDRRAAYDLAIDDEVQVFDRYRFSITLSGRVAEFATTNDGVKVVLSTTNNPQYPVGCSVWVSAAQLRPRVKAFS